MTLRFSIPGMHAYMAEVFPELGTRLEVLDMAPNRLTARMAAGPADLRPGGTVSGPALFALADCAFYMAVLAMIGPQPLAVTTSAAIDFMRRPAPGPLVARAEILKLGRTLAVGDVRIEAGADPATVARASFTYALPPGGATAGVDSQKRTRS